MDIRRAISEYVTQGRELLKRLRSPEEGPTVSPVDLHILRVQLFLLDQHAANMELMRPYREEAEIERKMQPSSTPPKKDRRSSF